jgi:hypothetical protein
MAVFNVRIDTIVVGWVVLIIVLFAMSVHIWMWYPSIYALRTVLNDALIQVFSYPTGICSNEVPVKPT